MSAMNDYRSALDKLRRAVKKQGAIADLTADEAQTLLTALEVHRPILDLTDAARLRLESAIRGYRDADAVSVKAGDLIAVMADADYAREIDEIWEIECEAANHDGYEEGRQEGARETAALYYEAFGV